MARVFDSSTAPTTQMGDGQFGSAAKGAATRAFRPEWIAKLNICKTYYKNGELKSEYVCPEEKKDALRDPPGNVTEPNFYSIGDVNKPRESWHFGGPGS